MDFLHQRLAITAVLFAFALGAWATWDFVRGRGVSPSYWGALVIGEILMVAQGVLGSRAAMGVVPVGSGNGLARALRIPLRPRQAFAALASASVRAAEIPAPSGEMFADSIRVEGLRLLAKHRIEEGISACVRYTRDQNPWASERRTPELMKILLTYGTHAKSVLPELTKIGDYFEKGEKDFPRELMLMKAKCVRETIRAIEAAADTPELINLK